MTETLDFKKRIEESMKEVDTLNLWLRSRPDVPPPAHPRDPEVGSWAVPVGGTVRPRPLRSRDTLVPRSPDLGSGQFLKVGTRFSGFTFLLGFRCRSRCVGAVGEVSTTRRQGTGSSCPLSRETGLRRGSRFEELSHRHVPSAPGPEVGPAPPG